MKKLAIVYTLCSAVAACVPSANAGAFADYVVSYTPGIGAAPGHSDPNAALGSPTRFIPAGPFSSVVCPFSPPYAGSDTASIGQGGQLTLRLSNYILTSTPGLQMGVFTGTGIVGGGTSASSLVADPTNTDGSMFAVHPAKLEVSADGNTWYPIGSGNQVFPIPTNGYSDVTNPFAGSPGGIPTNFSTPFPGSLSQLANKSYADMQAIYAGSGGGTWFDLSGTHLPQIEFVRFSLDASPDYGVDNFGGNNNHFELDALSINGDFIGAPTPEPASWVLAAAGLVAFVILAWRRGRRAASAAPLMLFF